MLSLRFAMRTSSGNAEFGTIELTRNGGNIDGCASRWANEKIGMEAMNPESVVVPPGRVTIALAVFSLATFWALPFSPFVAIAALMRTRRSVGWPRTLSVAAAVLCCVYTLAFAIYMYCVTIYVLTGGLYQ